MKNLKKGKNQPAGLNLRASVNNLNSSMHIIKPDPSALSNKQFYFDDDLKQFQGKRKKAQTSSRAVFQSVLINEKVVRPVELYLNDPLDKDVRAHKKASLEVLEDNKELLDRENTLALILI